MLMASSTIRSSSVTSLNCRTFFVSTDSMPVSLMSYLFSEVFLSTSHMRSTLPYSNFWRSTSKSVSAMSKVLPWSLTMVSPTMFPMVRLLYLSVSSFLQPMAAMTTINADNNILFILFFMFKSPRRCRILENRCI